MASKYLRGALIEFSDDFPLPRPKVIGFQFNPETMTHSWQPAKTAEGTPGNPSSPLAVTGSPEESFSFTLAMDSSDTIVTGGAGETLARTSGGYSAMSGATSGGSASSTHSRNPRRLRANWHRC